jgi:sialate O-acetylesterase
MKPFLNGKLIGSTNIYNKDRVYPIDGSLLKKGKNSIAIKVTDTGGGGGLFGNEEQLYLDANGNKNLTGRRMAL